MQSHVPSRDPVHEKIRRQLFESYEEYKTSHPCFPSMETDVFHSIKNHMSALYRAIANARAAQHQTQIKEAKEAALRSSWDELLKAVCCDVDDASSPYVMCACLIPLHILLLMNPLASKNRSHSQETKQQSSARHLVRIHKRP